MTERRATLCAWLRDAHAMERATVDNLERLLDRTGGYPALHEKLREHLDQSRDQLRRVEDCLHRLGTEPSMVKDAATRLTGVAQPWLAGISADEVVKNAMMACAFENFEVASYTALSTAAEACGELEVKRVCDEILEEERAMAEWLRQHLPEITRQHLEQDEAAGAGGRVSKVGAIVRENPVPTALAAAGLGWLITAGSRAAFRRSGGQARRSPAGRRKLRRAS